MEHEEEVWDVVQAKVCVAVRSTMDVFDRFTAKASDPILEPMLQSVPDPFDSYGPPQAEDQIFTILPPLAVMANVPSPSPSPLANTPPSGSDIPPPNIINNAWAPTGGFFANTTSEWSSTPSSPSCTPPRSASPSAAVKRRQSHPPPTNHYSRKSDSKLRSVLPIIDEPYTRHATEIAEAGRAEPRPPPSPEINGGSSSPPEPDTWGGFTYGEPLYTETMSGDETPRHSAITSSHTASYGHDQEAEPSDNQSDHTIQMDAEPA